MSWRHHFGDESSDESQQLRITAPTSVSTVSGYIARSRSSIVCRANAMSSPHTRPVCEFSSPNSWLRYRGEPSLHRSFRESHRLASSHASARSAIRSRLMASKRCSLAKSSGMLGDSMPGHREINDEVRRHIVFSPSRPPALPSRTALTTVAYAPLMQSEIERRSYGGGAPLPAIRRDRQR